MVMMIVLLHVISALSSVMLAALAWFWPSRRLLHGSAVLCGVMLASGTYLVWSRHLAIAHACLAGVTYLSLIILLLVADYRRLATAIK